MKTNNVRVGTRVIWILCVALALLPASCTQDHRCLPEIAALETANTALTNAQNAENAAKMARDAAAADLLVALAAQTAATVALLACVGGPIACAVAVAALAAATLAVDVVQDRYDAAQTAYERAQQATATAQTNVTTAQAALNACQGNGSNRLIAPVALSEQGGLGATKERLEDELRLFGNLREKSIENQMAFRKLLETGQFNDQGEVDIKQAGQRAGQRLKQFEDQISQTRIRYEAVLTQING